MNIDTSNDIDCSLISLYEEKKRNNYNNDNNDNIGDLYQLSNKFYELLNFKIGILLFFIYIFLNTDVFIENTISKIISGIYDYKNDKISNKGIIISGIILAILYILLDFLDKKNIL